jgi:hypothetical protein
VALSKQTSQKSLKMRLLRTTTILASALFALSAVPAFARESGSDANGKSAVIGAAQAAPDEAEALRSGLKAALDRVDALERRLQLLEQSAGMASAVVISDADQSAMRGMGLARQTANSPRLEAQATSPAPAPQPAAAKPALAQAEPDRKTAAPTDAVEAITRSEQGHFGRAVTFEAGASYSYFNSAQINLSGFLALDSIFLGAISVDEINSDVLTTDGSLRLGVTRRLQFDVNVPYLWRHTNYKSGGAGAAAKGLVEADVRDNGVGDVSFGASWRMLKETYHRPDVVLNIRGKAPTGLHPFGLGLIEVPGSEGNLLVPERLSMGTGTWGMSGGISLLKTIDPMVVFASFNYFYNFENHFDDISELPDTDTPLGRRPGSVKIGNAIQFGAGVAFALNEKSSLSFSFTERVVGRSKLQYDGFVPQTVVGSQANIAVFNFGATFALSDRLALLTNVGTGLTRDAPGLTVSLRLPYRF